MTMQHTPTHTLLFFQKEALSVIFHFFNKNSLKIEYYFHSFINRETVIWIWEAYISIHCG